jgi:hypothetical protein
MIQAVSPGRVADDGLRQTFACRRLSRGGSSASVRLDEMAEVGGLRKGTLPDSVAKSTVKSASSLVSFIGGVTVSYPINIHGAVVSRHVKPPAIDNGYVEFVVSVVWIAHPKPLDPMIAIPKNV